MYGVTCFEAANLSFKEKTHEDKFSSKENFGEKF